jgi:Polyketide cyclase / dehydrase and lipid transport
MPSTTASIEISATPDQIWSLAGGFTALKDWQPSLLKCEAGEGGRLRHIEAPTGEVIVERLEVFNDKERYYSYSLVTSPFPVRDYLATIRVSALDGQRSRVEWSGQFTAAGVSDDEAVALFQGIYSGGLASLQEQF